MVTRFKSEHDAQVEVAIVLALFDLSNHLLRRGERIARRGGLTAQQWFLLLHIADDPSLPTGAGRSDREPGVLASSLAEARGVSRANISGLLGSLLRRKLVRQRPDPRDGRRRRLEATEAGRRALAAIEPARRKANRLLLAGLSPGERRLLLGWLRGCLGVVLRERGEAAA
jgi:DNA-binding MarR family transcriptional regulator